MAATNGEWLTTLLSCHVRLVESLIRLCCVQCEYPQNLYSRMHPHQRAVVIPGAWGSTSGPRGGAAQFKLNCSSCPGPSCTSLVDMSCTSDPFSCSNLAHVDPGGSTNQSLNGLAWETDNVLTELGNDGNRPSQCWNLSMYDDFNVQNAQAYCKIV